MNELCIVFTRCGSDSFQDNDLGKTYDERDERLSEKREKRNN